jgi:hypothetical protein
MPFQSIQVDYTELPCVGHLKYFLIIRSSNQLGQGYDY